MIVVIVVLVVLASIGTYMLGQIVIRNPSPGGNPPLAIGVATTRSADGTNWTLTFTSVPSGLTTSGTRLTMFARNGSTALAAKPLNALVYSSDRAAYVQTVPSASLGIGDWLLISTTMYPAGYQYQLVSGSNVLVTGILQ